MAPDSAAQPEALEAELDQDLHPHWGTDEAIAAKLSLTRCHDPAFHRLRDALKRWFEERAE